WRRREICGVPRYIIRANLEAHDCATWELSLLVNGMKIPIRANPYQWLLIYRASSHGKQKVFNVRANRRRVAVRIASIEDFRRATHVLRRIVPDVKARCANGLTQVPLD